MTTASSVARPGASHSRSLGRIGLSGTDLARATCGSIQLRLLKIGALVRISVRRVKVAMSSAWPYQQHYRTAYAALTR